MLASLRNQTHVAPQPFCTAHAVDQLFAGLTSQSKPDRKTKRSRSCHSVPRVSDCCCDGVKRCSTSVLRRSRARRTECRKRRSAGKRGNLEAEGEVRLEEWESCEENFQSLCISQVNVRQDRHRLYVDRVSQRISVPVGFNLRRGSPRPSAPSCVPVPSTISTRSRS